MHGGRQELDDHEYELKMLIRAEVEQQERFEAMGYRSPTWRLSRALQSLFSAVQLQGESAVTAPPFFPSAGRGATRFWGKKQGPTIFLWESLGEEGREECERVIRTHRDCVVWSRARPMKGDCTLVVITGPFIKNLLHNHSVIYKIIIFFFRRSKRQRKF